MKSLKAELIPKFKLEFRLFSVLLTAVIPVLQEQDHATIMSSYRGKHKLRIVVEGHLT